VLLTAGTAIGLSLVSPYPSQSYGKLAGSIAAFWAIAVPIISFLVGGYLAGRMRAAWDETRAEEVEFRDGVHGLLVWAVSIIIGAALAFFTLTAAAQTGAEVAKAASSDRAAVIAPAADSILRGGLMQTATPTSRTTETSPAGTRTPSSATSPSVETRGEVTRTLTAAVSQGQLTASDKGYLAQVVTQYSGLPPNEAEKRVDEAYAMAVQAVEKARKAAVLAGLVTATALLLGLAAAWYAAQRGGHHRDQNIPAKFGLAWWPATGRKPAP
jgi:hypothetical protein